MSTISTQDQLIGLKDLDKAYEEYRIKGEFLFTNILYERTYSFINEILGMDKLIEIASATNGTKEATRKAHIIYLFDNVFATQKKQ